LGKVITLSRAAISFFALAYGLYHGALGLLNLEDYDRSAYALFAIALYFLALLVSISHQPGLRLTNKKAAFSLVTALVIPLLMNASASGDYSGNHSTWYVAGVATLMAVVALRQHKVMAWFGGVVSAAEVILWGGLDSLFSAGIFGAVTLVSAAHAASVTLASSAKAAEDFRERALATEAATAAKTAARNERQLRVEQALGVALPILNQIEQQAGNLNQHDRIRAVALEATLRDRIRGRHFESPKLLSEIAAARARGVEVQVLDDGGLEKLTEQERESLLAEVATYVATVFAGRLVLRSVADEPWTVTVTASRPGYDAPDLFIRL
jgi:hypothetical protein